MCKDASLISGTFLSDSPLASKTWLESTSSPHQTARFQAVLLGSLAAPSQLRSEWTQPGGGAGGCWAGSESCLIFHLPLSLWQDLAGCGQAWPVFRASVYLLSNQQGRWGAGVLGLEMLYLMEEPLNQDSGVLGLVRSGGAGSHGGASAKRCHCCVPYCEVGVAVSAAGGSWTWRQRCWPCACCTGLLRRLIPVSHFSQRQCSEGDHTGF